MKLISAVLIMASIYSCSTSRNTINQSFDNKDLIQKDSSNIFEIIGIDSIQNIYVILARRNELVYKVVSFQDSSECTNKIKKGNYYNLLLNSVFPENYLSKDRISSVRYGDVKVPLGGDKNVVWDLFSTPNLKGICLN
ncbi:MAG TPA: hypothetical protein DEU93_05355 [Chitinophagaceae bacterium]|nr:hypothetical protein [Chitinophagaceae bacterium]HML56851.1 hypothetical protein [Ferruginibacter sp.]